MTEQRIDQTIRNVGHFMDRQVGDHPRPIDYVQSYGTLMQVEATLLLAQQVERIADRLEAVADRIDLFAATGFPIDSKSP